MIIAGHNVTLVINSVTHDLAKSITVEIDRNMLIFNDYQSTKHYYKAEETVIGNITEFTEDFAHISTLIGYTSGKTVTITSNIGSSKILTLTNVVFKKFNLGFEAGNLVLTGIEYTANDFSIS